MEYEVLPSGEVMVVKTVGTAIVKEFYDMQYHIDLEYNGSTLQAITKDYQGTVVNYFPAITFVINGEETTVESVKGIATMAHTLSGHDIITTKQEVVRNGELIIVSPPDQINQLEADNAMLTLALAESDARLAQTDQTVADLMLAIVSGGV